MANWCSTTLWFYSENFDTLEDFHDFVTESFTKDEVEEGLYRNSLKNILIDSGIDTDDDTIKHRGTVEYISGIEFNGSLHFFIVDTETAWVPMIKMWIEVLKAHGIDNEVGVAYEAVECGSDIYSYHDETGELVTDRVNIDSYKDIQGFYDSLDDAHEVLREFFKVPDATEEELKSLVDKYNEDGEGYDFIYIHVFEEAGLLEYY